MVRTLLSEVKRMSNRALLISVIFIALVSFAVLRKDSRPDTRGKGIVTASVVPDVPIPVPSPVQTTTPQVEQDNPLKHLDYKFGFNSTLAGSPNIQEESLKPGERITLNLDVINNGPTVVDGLKLIVEPAVYLDLAPLFAVGQDDRARYDKEDSALLRQLTTTGVSVIDFNRQTKIFPQNDPHYPKNRGALRLPMRFEDRLRLNPNLQPGQDIQFRGYLVYQGHKVSVGTLMVHVMYSG